MYNLLKGVIVRRAESNSKFVLYMFMVLLVVIVSVIVRVYDIDKPAIWSDEAFTLVLSALSPREIIFHTVRDVHPPFYYLVLHVWMEAFGNGVFAARSLSALAGVVSVLLGIWLASLIGSRRAALLGGLLLALLPMGVRYSQEVRMYAFFGMLMVGAAIAFLYWSRNVNNIKALAVFSVLMLFGFYTHYFAGVCLVSFWVYLLFRYLGGEDNCLRSPSWWVANFSVALLYIPWLPNLLNQMEYSGFQWIVRPDVYTVFSTVWEFISYSDGRQLWAWVYFGVPLALFVLSLGLGVRGKIKWEGGLYLFVYTWLPLLVVVMISLVRPLFVDRYFLFAALGLPLIMGVVIDDLWSKRKVYCSVLLVAILLFELSGLYGVYQKGHAVYEEVNRSDVMMGYVNSHALKGDDVLVLNMHLYFPVYYYNRTEIVPRFFTPPAQDGSSTRPEGYQIWTLIQNNAEEIYTDSLSDLAPVSRRAWLLTDQGSEPHFPDCWRLLDVFKAGDSFARLYEIHADQQVVGAPFHPGK
ncbi:glycosyltransferase family 39 protein [Pseudomonas fluorescens]|uniref:glycosyltransferase family 39 protein n=1 Tax=Pseudomonas fluorescens TaxID=294 RepID=UPI00259B8C7F|nr:glycosyltransferase family 39 protein [Pseudomonas fluorescens]WJK08810.1 glycosyltransferase family 39 protein [Pseudomonas fluorescens]